ncbi:sucrose phosphorylase [Cellulomonas phragmiteti]|uniref:Sucrose phosphorylase n=1 Tax=Cellulomonas phragmiteti TaxID=478780 RepID=A0ABQ4DQJ1_9CELL|nr:sucrose phosphorylase [Cellulomonas phragmiteti]GIG41599.1 sucrose phosphorylase [Cellulomonas phragmiteti]
MTFHGPQLITYADRLAGDLRGLRTLLDGPLAGAFDGVHLLPFYPPYDGADAGFDPRDHTAVDPRLGSWDDVRALAGGRTVMADVIVNHVSAESERFRDVRERGDDSPHAPMFLTLGAVFPDGATEEDLARVYRPRPGLPFTVMTLGGRRRLVWTTFTPDQVDIDLRTPQAWEYLTSVVDALTSGGVTMLRLDAVGYTGKEAGTDCFMTPATDAYTERIVAQAHERGAQVLVEVHGHHTQQIEIARKVDLVYDFALPPLVLHALTAGDLEPLAGWLQIRPANAVTVLDTHDGIGIVDVGPSDLRPGEPGLLAPEKIDALVERIHENSGGTSRQATGAAASNLDLYQVNCTFYDALARDDRRYVLARLIQLFVPGIPQVYYVGLLAGANDMDLLAATGVGRDVNRHHFTPEEVTAALEHPAVRGQLAGLRLRSSHAAFGGTFEWDVDGTRGCLAWTAGEARATLTFDVADGTFAVHATGDDGEHVVLAHTDVTA